MSDYFKGKKILVTGGTGLIGIPLVKKLAKYGGEIRVVSLDEKSPFEKDIEFVRGDLCDKKVCESALSDIQMVFHLAGIKGGIGVAKTKAATFLIKNVLMNIQLMEAARVKKIESFSFVSSICVYPPAEVFEEKNAFTGLPHPSDLYGGMGKLVGELQVEAYKLQYDLDNFLVTRPVNTYGPYDNFNPESALIIPALIHRIFNGENPMTIWGDGSAVRDFIYTEDVADILLIMAEKKSKGPFNIGSGKGHSIKDVAESVVKYGQEILGQEIPIVWDTSKPSGEKYRVASMKKVESELGWKAPTDLDAGILKTMKWYHENSDKLFERFSILNG